MIVKHKQFKGRKTTIKRRPDKMSCMCGSAAKGIFPINPLPGRNLCRRRCLWWCQHMAAYADSFVWWVCGIPAPLHSTNSNHKVNCIYIKPIHWINLWFIDLNCYKVKHLINTIHYVNKCNTNHSIPLQLKAVDYVKVLLIYEWSHYVHIYI